MTLIKILHLIKGLGTGGAEKLLLTTLPQHSKEIFQFHCIYFLPHKDQLKEPLLQTGACVNCFKANHQFKMLHRVKDIADYIRANQIDIIHAHLPWPGIIATRVAEMVKVPVVYTEHNNVERYHPISRFINRLSYSKYQRVITVSEDSYRAAVEQFHGSCPTHIQTIYNGVDTDEFPFHDTLKKERAKCALGISPNSLVITNAAVFRHQKRLDRWLEIAKTFLTKYEKIVFYLLGSGPLQEKVKGWVIENGLLDKINMPGLQKDIRPWLAATDIFLMSSDFEGLPVALLEAMSMGCVPVVTDVGGMPEVVNDACGIIYEKDDINSAAQALEFLYTHTDLRKQLSYQAYIRIRDHFSLREMVDKLEIVYLELFKETVR